LNEGIHKDKVRESWKVEKSEVESYLEDFFFILLTKKKKNAIRKIAAIPEIMYGIMKDLLSGKIFAAGLGIIFIGVTKLLSVNCVAG
jgi:phosphatidylglycerophosphatase A